MPYHNADQIISAVFNAIVGEWNSGLPIQMDAPALVGTTQDDPFDRWVSQYIERKFPELEVSTAGKLTTPDLILRDRKTKILVGIEIKKLIENKKGDDPRGLTIDYNSCLPCGTALIKIGDRDSDIPCYYLFALLNSSSTKITTCVLMHGDFLNYDFNLHKEAKVANISEYGHGPYGEGSVRHRAMYTYPNPLNSKLVFFHQKLSLVIKYEVAEQLSVNQHVRCKIQRQDIYNNVFEYKVVQPKEPKVKEAPTFTDIFKECKERKSKERTSYMVRIDEA